MLHKMFNLQPTHRPQVQPAVWYFSLSSLKDLAVLLYCGWILTIGQTFMFRKYSYKETKKGTENFGIVIGQGGFGTVYKAQFNDGLVLAVKRMDKVSEQGEDDFCRELELLARLHHRHLVALRGFCVEKHER